MKNILILGFLLIALNIVGRAQVVSGIVKSARGENVAYAFVYDSLTQRGVYTGTDGRFVLVGTKPNHLIKVSHVSHAPALLNFKTERDTFLVVRLSELEIEEVLVKATSLKHQSKLGIHFMEKRTLENIPSFFGEADLMKAMTALPGISNGLDLYSAVYVRGGNRDQNLFLIEGARYYVTSHAGGYVSLFNPEIISHVDIYKGVAPAKYGDAISSVVDVKLSEGSNEPKLNIDIGTLRSGFVFETRGDRKWHAFVAGRTANVDMLTGVAFRKFKDIRKVDVINEYYTFGFNDLDGKVTFKPTNRTSISLNAHLGNDENASYVQSNWVREDLGQVFTNKVGGDFIKNHNITLNASHVFPSGISLRNTAWFTYYDRVYRRDEDVFRNFNPIGKINYSRRTYLYDRSNRTELSIPVGGIHLLKTGFQATSFTVNPLSGRNRNEIFNTDSLFGVPDNNAFESAVFVDGTLNLTPRTSLKAGIRGTWLSTSDTSFFYVEPRLQFNHELSETWSWQLGASMNSQPLHDLVQAYGDYENESWVLADGDTPPQHAQQISTGLFGKLPGTTIDLSFELYYKTMSNLLYLNPIGFDVNSIFDFLYKNGKGKSYGGEVLLKKSNGNFQWSLAYTLSASKRKFEGLNNGEWFNSDFDRRHDLNLGIHYYSGKKNVWNANYIFQTGRPFTMPLSQVAATSFYQRYYVIGDTNNAQMPNYKRFDIAYKHIGKIFWGRKVEYTFSVMNVFARKNPYSVYIKNNKLYMTSMYTVLPSVNIKIYTFKTNKQ